MPRKAAAAKVGEARSGGRPKVALFGNLEVIANAHDAGIVSPAEKRSWLVGVGMEVPIFDGFLSRNQVREAVARVSQLKHKKALLREGLGLQVKEAWLQLNRLQRQEGAAGAALFAARENRRLNERA